MARRHTGPRYYPSMNGFYVVVKGVRECLAKGPEDDPEVRSRAEFRYHQLMLAPRLDGDRMTCQEFLGLALENARVNLKPKAVQVRTHAYENFNAALGGVRVCDLKAHMVNAWFDKMSIPRPHPTKGTLSWGDSTKNIVCAALKAAFNWGRENELITSDPLKKVKKVAAKSRGAESFVNDESHAVMMKHANPEMGQLFTALYETGARPGEVFSVTAADYSKPTWTLKEHKTSRFRKQRVIFLNETMVSLTESLVKKNPRGPLFLNTLGRPWMLKSVDSQVAFMREKFGLGKFTCYGYRHAYARRFLLNGGSIAYLAELMGNTVAVIEKHYGFIRENRSHLLKALEHFGRPGRGDSF